MLVIKEKRYLLIPKSVVGYNNDYTPQKFHTHFALNFLQQRHLRLNTALVQRRYRKDGSIRTFVTKKSIREKESLGTKDDLNNFVDKYPQIFKDFKKAKAVPSRSFSNEAIAKIEISELVSYLHNKLTSLPPGRNHAPEYHDLIIGILEFLLYPELTCPQKEKPIHDGRKRIDITFDNAAYEGVFFEISKDTPCQFIFVECKNYADDPKNPELDQLASRFSPNRGKVGLLVCRQINDIEAFYARCSDAYKDDRGLILPVTDIDLIAALTNVKNEIELPLSELLRNCRRIIQMN